MILKTLVSLCILGVSSAFLLSDPTDWNDLKITWGINPFTSFNSAPRTAKDALADGFVKISSCDESAGSKWRGNRYVKNNDTTLILIFGKNGYIAGVQGGIVEDPKTGYPKKVTAFVKDGDMYFITAYFVNPDIICSTGRTQAHFESVGTGSELLIQTGPNPLTDLMEVPLKEEDVHKIGFVKGKCFKTMGNHYWFKVYKNTTCDSFFPVFTLFNRGSLNAFGWAFAENVDSPRTEHPTQKVYNAFMEADKIPTCLSAADSTTELTTMHIYLTSSPLTDWC